MRSMLVLGLLLVGCDGVMEDQGAGDGPPGAAPVAGADAGELEADAGPTARDAGEPADAAVELRADAGLSAGAGDAGVVERPDAGLSPDAGPTPDAGQPPTDAGSVNVLIAQGRLGRTTLSCDDGLTWVHDADQANGARCGEAPLVECFHHPWASMGLVSTGTSVLATFGWGAPGTVRRTTDGVTWSDVLTGATFSGLTAGNGVVVGGGNPVTRSTAGGAPGSWAAGGQAAINSVSRHLAYLPAGSGRFLQVFDDGVFASDDGAVTWSALTVPAACRGPRMGVLTHDATVVLVLWSGGLCTSTDRGATWAARQLDTAFTSAGTWGQGAFHVWNGSTRYRSVDGLTWASAPGTAGVSIGAVAVTAAGTFVSFKGGWRSDYQDERVYRSADGLTWQTIPAANHAHSHPITHLIAAQVRPSSACR